MAWPVNARTSAMLDEAQSLYGATITATQGSPNPGGVGASAGTHDGEGVIDVVGADLDAIVIAMRQVGFAAWHRTPAQGFIHHVHGVAVGEPGLSPQAATQVQAYFAGRNGLAGVNGLGAPDDGPRDWVGVTWETYTGGTYTPPATGTGDPVRTWNQYPGDRSGAYLYAPDGILAGSPTVPFDPGYTNFYAADIPTPSTSITLTAGDSVMLAALEDFDYGEPVDLQTGYWLVRWTGGGTLTVADAYDEGYNYPTVTPTWAARTQSGVDAAGLTYFTFDPDQLDADHLYNEGQPLIRVTCTSGTAVIDFIGLQVQGAAGFWVADGEEEWSASVGASSQILPAPGFDGTYDITDGGGGPLTNTWTIDGTPVYQFEPLPGGDTDTFGRQFGSEFSLTSAEDAVDQRDANIQTLRAGSAGTAAWSLRYDDGAALLPAPESWQSILDETPQLWAAPTKSEMPGAPFNLPPVGWERTSTYEWFGDDTSKLGWVIGPTDVPGFKYVQVSGDAQTAFLYVNTFNEFVDSETFDHHSGSLVASWDKDTDEDLNLGGPYLGVQGTFDAVEVPVSDGLLILTLDSTIREATDFRHTYSSSTSIEAFTGASLALVNIPVAPRFRVPGYRYAQPSFVQAPTFTPVIDFDEDPTVTWLRQRQRDDGLGSSVVRAKRGSSRQKSLRQRGYR